MNFNNSNRQSNNLINRLNLKQKKIFTKQDCKGIFENRSFEDFKRKWKIIEQLFL